MPPHLRHLHELAPGERFRFQHSPRPYQLVTVTRSSCIIRGTATEQPVRFRDAHGTERTFVARRGAERRCAPGAMVVRLPAQEAQ
jgi:hypothetical protein